MRFPDNIIGLKDLKKEELELIFKETASFKKKILKKEKIKETLNGKSVINLFFENSTRTRISFELAEKTLGMKVVNFTSDTSSLSKGESVLDTLRNIEAMKFDYIVSRHPAPGFPEMVLMNTTSKLISGGDGTNEHPTQGLLDIFTLKEVFKKLDGLRVCIVGNVSHSRVAKSNIFGLKKLGAKVSVCAPNTFIPVHLKKLGVTFHNTIEDAIKKSDALILLRVQLERNAGYLLPTLNEFSKYYGISRKRIESNPEIKILHPGPWNKNVELDEDIIESPNFLGFEQVTNGVAVKLALFNLMNKS